MFGDYKTHLLERENKTRCGRSVGPCSLIEIARDISDTTCVQCSRLGNTWQHSKLYNERCRNDIRGKVQGEDARVKIKR